MMRLLKSIECEPGQLVLLHPKSKNHVSTLPEGPVTCSVKVNEPMLCLGLKGKHMSFLTCHGVVSFGEAVVVNALS